MGGVTNYPSALDDNTSLYDVVDSTTAIIAAHHNNIKEAAKAIEAKLGIYNTSVSTSIDYRLGHPSSGHAHDAASGQGRKINPTTILVPSGGYPDALSLHDHLMARPRHIVTWQWQGSTPSGASLGGPMVFPRTMQVESVTLTVKKPPTGATLAFDVNVGPTSLWQASQGNRPVLPIGSAYYGHASPNFVTYPSGALFVVDADKVGTTEPGSEVLFTFVFKD